MQSSAPLLLDRCLAPSLALVASFARYLRKALFSATSFWTPLRLGDGHFQQASCQASWCLSRIKMGRSFAKKQS